MLTLKDNCVHPTSQQPYIKSASGGKDNSPEGIQVSFPEIPKDGKLRGYFTNARQNGITHAFVVEFASAADRDYYVQSDPSHLAFVKTLDGLIEKAQVIDFTDRVL